MYKKPVLRTFILWWNYHQKKSAKLIRTALETEEKLIETVLNVLIILLNKDRYSFCYGLVLIEKRIVNEF
jgi:hypothetical protein